MKKKHKFTGKGIVMISPFYCEAILKKKLQGNSRKESPESGWLKKQFDEVKAEVESWPDWKKGESLEKKDES